MSSAQPPESVPATEAPSLTPWHLDEVAAGYDAWENTSIWVFGYPFLFQELGLGARPVERALDLGCGPGFVSEHVAARYGVRMTAADASPGMIRRATEHHAHPLVEYRLMTDGGLEFLDDASVDAAWSSFVFITVPERDMLRRLAAEAFRVLRPGGPYTVLDVNPDAVGVRFSSFQVGEPGRTYGDGEPLPSQLYDGEEVLNLLDVHWSEAAVVDVLTGAGFVDLHVRKPLLADAVELAEPELVGRSAWEQERTIPPLVLLTGTKPH